MTRRIVALALLSVILTACGATSGGNPGSSPTPKPPEPLFAVLRTQGAGTAPSQQPTPDTIAIVRADGSVRAQARFSPRTVPEVADAVPVLDTPARIANGAVYFIDLAGVVRRLDPTGAVQTSTTFALTSRQQIASFVVRPDGKQLMATVFTHPSVTYPPSGGFPITSGPETLDLEIADAGGTARVIQHWEGTTVGRSMPGFAQFHNLTMAAWDATGPIVLVDGHEAIQQALIQGAQWAGGYLARLNLDGTIGARLTPSDCVPYGIDQQGAILCTSADANGITSVRILSPSGQLRWQTGAGSGMYGFAGNYALSPDGLRLAMTGAIVPNDAGQITMDGNFAPQGWLDNQTVVGLIRNANPMRMGVFRINSATTVADWSANGQFVGRVMPAGI